MRVLFFGDVYFELEELRKVGRPRARWKDEVWKDARMTGVRR
jgi:hypothetical protein